MSAKNGLQSIASSRAMTHPLAQEEDFIQISIRSQKNIRINETLELPASVTLATLRQFLKKTYPYLPGRFRFQNESVLIEQSFEKTVPVGFMGKTLFLVPYVPNGKDKHFHHEPKSPTFKRTEQGTQNGLMTKERGGGLLIDENADLEAERLSIIRKRIFDAWDGGGRSAPASPQGGKAQGANSYSLVQQRTAQPAPSISFIDENMAEKVEHSRAALAARNIDMSSYREVSHRRPGGKFNAISVSYDDTLEYGRWLSEALCLHELSKAATKLQSFVRRHLAASRVRLIALFFRSGLDSNKSYQPESRPSTAESAKIAIPQAMGHGPRRKKTESKKANDPVKQKAKFGRRALKDEHGDNIVPGDPVDVYDAGRDVWLPGRITGADKNQTFDIYMHSGECKFNIHRKFIRKGRTVEHHAHPYTTEDTILDVLSPFMMLGSKSKNFRDTALGTGLSEDSSNAIERTFDSVHKERDAHLQLASELAVQTSNFPRRKRDMLPGSKLAPVPEPVRQSKPEPASDPPSDPPRGPMPESQPEPQSEPKSTTWPQPRADEDSRKEEELGRGDEDLHTARRAAVQSLSAKLVGDSLREGQRSPIKSDTHRRMSQGFSTSILDAGVERLVLAQQHKRPEDSRLA
jgi:hypothetical protein